MSEIISMLVFLLLTAFGTWVCEHVAGLRRRSWAVGLVFGALAIGSDLLACRIDGWLVLLSCVLPICSVFFFGSASGLVSAAVVSCWAYVAYPQLLRDVGSTGCLVWAVTPLVVALYAIAVRRWFFFSRRPAPLPAAIIAMFAAMFQKTIENVSRSDVLSIVVEVAHHVVLPELVGSAVLVVLVACVCGEWRDWRRNFAAENALALILFFVGFGLMSWFVIDYAERQTDEEVKDAQQRLEHDIDDQLGFALHGNADAIVDLLGSATNVTMQKAAECAAVYEVDTLEVVDRNGEIVVTNEPLPDTLDRRLYFKNPDTIEFLALTNGAVPFVKQRFRECVSNGRVTKYIGVPFPDGSGFIQLGYLRSRLEQDFSKFFFPMLEDMMVGKSGYYLVLDRRNGVVACRSVGRKDIVGKTAAEIGLVRPEGAADHFDVFDAPVFGRLSRCIDTHIGNWSVYSVVPLVDAYGQSLLGLFLAGALLQLICMAFCVAIFRFKTIQAKVDRLRANEDARREKDLALARTIQRSAIPFHFPDEADYRIDALMDAAKEVGGDFYDFFLLPSGEIGFLVADVSGKSIPGAMFMMQAKMVLRSSIFSSSGDFAAAVAEANARLCENNAAEMFVTAWIGAFDRKTGVVRFVNAGHNPPLVKRAGGWIEWLRMRPCMPLAALAVAKYRVETFTLKAGDVLLLYTDGVTEANNAAMELYGESRLATAFVAAGADCVADIRADVDRFVVGAEQADDITLLALNVKEQIAND